MIKERNCQQEIDWLIKEKYPGFSFEEKLTNEMKRDIARIKKGEPIAYVIGDSRFLNCRIDLSLKPSIPRPETEFWAEKAIAKIKKTKSRKIYCLDIFSGSGCIGIAVLKHLNNAQVDFAEKDKKLLKQIEISAKLNNLDPKRYRTIRSDIFKNITGSYDYIFANPPYVATSRRNKVQKSVIRFEPARALFGGRDGLLYIRKFLREAQNHLANSGKIYLEFDSPQKTAVGKILRKLGYRHCEFLKDQYGKWRYLIAG